MGNIQGKGIHKATISARVIRADGTVEDLGVIARKDAPWWKRLARRVRQWLTS